MQALLFNADHPQWGSELERAGIVLGATENPALFPYHFLYVTFGKIGGWLAVFMAGGQRSGVGFLFPRGLAPGSEQPIYTLRYHPLTPLDSAGRAAVTQPVPKRSATHRSCSTNRQDRSPLRRPISKLALWTLVVLTQPRLLPSGRSNKRSGAAPRNFSIPLICTARNLLLVLPW